MSAPYPFPCWWLFGHAWKWGEALVEEFSRGASYERPSEISAVLKGERVHWTERAQYRTCSKCGRTERRVL